MLDAFFSRLVDYKNPQSFASRLRAKRARHVVGMIDEICRKKGFCTILDVGGTVAYWNIVSHAWLREHKVKIILLNLQAASVQTELADVFESVGGNACAMPEFPDQSFDIVHSNSVIEHVGLWRDMKAMSAEVQRIGKSYYLQTPNFWFPIEPHYFFPVIHWLPMPWRVALAMRWSLGSWPKAKTVSEAVTAQQAAILLSAKMLRSLFPDAQFVRERFLGLTKSLIVLKPQRLA